MQGYKENEKKLWNIVWGIFSRSNGWHNVYYGTMEIILTIHNQSFFFTVRAKPVCNYSITKKMNLHVQIEKHFARHFYFECKKFSVKYVFKWFCWLVNKKEVGLSAVFDTIGE